MLLLLLLLLPSVSMAMISPPLSDLAMIFVFVVLYISCVCLFSFLFGPGHDLCVCNMFVVLLFLCFFGPGHDLPHGPLREERPVDDDLEERHLRMVVAIYL